MSESPSSPPYASAAMPQLTSPQPAATRTSSAGAGARKSRPEALSLKPMSFKSNGPKSGKTPRTPTSATDMGGGNIVVPPSPRNTMSATELMVQFYQGQPSPHPNSAGAAAAAAAASQQQSMNQTAPPPIPAMSRAHEEDVPRMPPVDAATLPADQQQPHQQTASAIGSDSGSMDPSAFAELGHIEFPDVSIADCQAAGLQKLLVSRIPLCYFLGHHIDTFAPENLRLAALQAWGMSDPVACFEAVREGVMTMLEESWIAFKKGPVWRGLIHAHSNRTQTSSTMSTGSGSAMGASAGTLGYTVMDLNQAIAYVVSHLNKRYPLASSHNASPRSGTAAATKSMRKMGLTSGGSHGGSDSDDEFASPQRLIRRKAAHFVEYCCNGEVPDAIAAELYSNKKRVKAAAKRAALAEAAAAKSEGSSSSSKGGLLKLFGFGKKK
ncbi:hypothetical protein BCR44DRAFT_1427606 [Catenaria anguillulae PL171]|uniref:Uncharacterized protein n=1 Tax=Catenaria anguillulae PL171 TaxID=765915 RepID=A0A1Y2HZY3_9FUNG|nr:hypothetical protein BCR44DRAFT_1427606 [Catenaria anguillulae PL171]